MSDDPSVGPLISRIVTVLAVSLVLSLGGLVALGLFGGDPAVSTTLTHLIETLTGVFVGIAAARLAE